MGIGAKATFVISWAQTEVDGLPRAGRDLVRRGSHWRWTGAALRIDVPLGPLVLAEDGGAAHERLWAASSVRRLISTAMTDSTASAGDDEAHLDGFVVTDGLRSYELTVIEEPSTGARLVMAETAMPPAGTDLWVTRIGLPVPPPIPRRTTPQAGVICFCPGMRLATVQGALPIETLRQGDRLLTKDNGPQEILWIGQCQISGARLHAMPHLRPVRLLAGALGLDRPEADLIVSPQHRMLIAPRTSRGLFGGDEVLVAACDLVDNRTVTRAADLRQVTYIHVLLAHHNIIWANGLETESFHPGHMDLDGLAPDQRAGLTAALPDPAAYGADVRRAVDPAGASELRRIIAA